MTRWASRATSRACVATSTTTGPAARSSPTVLIRQRATAVVSKSWMFSLTSPAYSAASPSSRRSSRFVSSAPASASSGAPPASFREQPREGARPSQRARRPVRGRNAWQRVDVCEHGGIERGVPLEHQRRPHHRCAHAGLAVLGSPALQLVLDRGQRPLIEQRQVARDRVERVIGGDAMREGAGGLFAR